MYIKEREISLSTLPTNNTNFRFYSYDDDVCFKVNYF